MFNDLTPTQAAIAEFIDDSPRAARDVSENFGMSESTARDHISAIGKQYDLSNVDGEYQFMPESSGEVGPTTIRRTTIGSTTKAAQTRKATNELEAMESRLMKMLEGTEPVRADGGIDTEPGNQDVIIYRTDDHFGAYDEDQFGETIYNAQIAEDRVQQHFDAAFGTVNFRRRAGIDFDTCYIVLGGDLLDGEGIYDGQAWHQEMGLGEQIEYVAEVYLNEIRRAATKFDNVVVACQGGNHGEIRLASGGSSSGANADGFVFTSIDLALRFSDIDNVSLLRSDATNYLNFEARGHKFHIRHGQNGLGHIGTSSGKQRWGAWKARHDFDVAMRGHFHEVKLEPVEAAPVFMGGTISPGGEFAEQIGVGESKPQGWVIGISDHSPTQWMEIVDFE